MFSQHRQEQLIIFVYSTDSLHSMNDKRHLTTYVPVCNLPIYNNNTPKRRNQFRKFSHIFFYREWIGKAFSRKNSHVWLLNPRSAEIFERHLRVFFFLPVNKPVTIVKGVITRGGNGVDLAGASQVEGYICNYFRVIVFFDSFDYSLFSLLHIIFAPLPPLKISSGLQVWYVCSVHMPRRHPLW